MRTSIKENFISTYTPLLKSFLDKIEKLDCTGIQEPFFHAFGTGYQENPYKIAFIGMEGADNVNSQLSEFINAVKNNSLEVAICRWDKEFKEEFCNQEYYLKGTFWKFIKTFLIKFYYTNDCDESLIQSIVYGNVNSFEKFNNPVNVNKGIPPTYANWEVLKKQSEIFDKADNIIDAFCPRIIILLNKNSDKWFSDPHLISWQILIKDRLRFGIYHGTYIYWTDHPRYLIKIGHEYVINSILFSIHENKTNILSGLTFHAFPGNKLAESVIFLKNKFEELGNFYNLNFSSELLKGNKSGFYFTNSKWGNCMIGFEYEDSWFFGGICLKNENSPINLYTAISQKQKDVNLKSTPFWPYWFWLKDEYQNWNSLMLSENQNQNFVLEVERNILEMLQILEDILNTGISI